MSLPIFWVYVIRCCCQGVDNLFKVTFTKFKTNMGFKEKKKYKKIIIKTSQSKGDKSILIYRIHKIVLNIPMICITNKCQGV